MHSRTMNRRLSEFGVGFQQLVDESRFEFAQQLMEDSSLDLARISAMLGYAAPGVFTRAFLRWSGMTPVEWRGSRTTPRRAARLSTLAARNSPPGPPSLRPGSGTPHAARAADQRSAPMPVTSRILRSVKCRRDSSRRVGSCRHGGRMESRALRRKFLVGLFAGLHVVWPILSGLLALIVAFGIVAGLIESWSLHESIHFAFVSGLTIGYGDFAPQVPRHGRTCRRHRRVWRAADRPGCRGGRQGVDGGDR